MSEVSKILDEVFGGVPGGRTLHEEQERKLKSIPCPHSQFQTAHDVYLWADAATFGNKPVTGVDEEEYATTAERRDEMVRLAMDPKNKDRPKEELEMG